MPDSRSDLLADEDTLGTPQLFAGYFLKHAAVLRALRRFHSFLKAHKLNATKHVFAIQIIDIHGPPISLPPYVSTYVSKNNGTLQPSPNDQESTCCLPFQDIVLFSWPALCDRLSMCRGIPKWSSSDVCFTEVPQPELCSGDTCCGTAVPRDGHPATEPKLCRLPIWSQQETLAPGAPGKFDHSWFLNV